MILGVWTVVGGGNTLHMRPLLLALFIVGLACYYYRTCMYATNADSWSQSDFAFPCVGIRWSRKFPIYVTDLDCIDARVHRNFFSHERHVQASSLGLP